MYIYFDSNGTIKEIVNDVAIRKGSADYNKLYVYIEGNPEIDDIWYFQKFPNGSTSNEVSFINNVVIKSIPYNAKRDMTYFKDFVQYKFYVFTLTSEYLNISGLAIGTIRIAVDNSIFALGELTFNIQANEVKEDNGITQSQYDYLLLAYASRTLNEQTGSDLQETIDDIINAKVQELNPLQPSGTGTTAYITSQTSDIGILISTDNGHWYYWNGTQYADGGNYQAPFYNSSNKLNADYVDDTSSTNKFVTASEKAQIGTNATNIATNTIAIANRYTKAETNTLLGKKANYIDFDNSADVSFSNNIYTITGETAEIIKSMNCIIKCTAETFSNMFFPDNFDMVLLPSCIENGLYIYKCVYNNSYGNNVLYTPFYIEDDVLKAKFTLVANPIDEKSTISMKLITNVRLSSYGNPIQKRMYFKYGDKNIVNENTYEDFFKIALINGDAVFGGNGTTLDFTATNGQLKNVKLNSNNYHVFNNQEDLVDNLTSNDTTKGLTAKQGEILKGLIDNAIKDLKWELGSHTLDVSNDDDTAHEKQVPNNTIGCQINKLGGMSYKSYNLIGLTDTPETTVGGITYKIENGVVTFSGTSNQQYGTNIFIPLINPIPSGYAIAYNPFKSDASYNFIYLAKKINVYSGNIHMYQSGTTTTTEQFNYLLLQFPYNTTYTTTTVQPMVIRGTTEPTTYQPYFEGIRDSAVTNIISKDSNNTTLETLSISSQIQNLTGYGWGINDTCYNYIDFDRKVFVQKVGRVDLGSLDWNYRVGTNRQYYQCYSIQDSVLPVSNNVVANMLTSVFTNDSANNTYSNITDNTISITNEGVIQIYASAYTSASELATALDGVYLYYELATPVETDISAYLTTDTIEVEALGELSFTNAYSQDVPSDIDYLIEVAN